MPQAYGYIRVSDDRQAASGLGLAAQRARIEEYCARVLPAIPLLDVLADEAVSASQIPFLRRLQGKRLDGLVCRGDHVVIAKLDRAFRSLRDCATMMDHWSARGVIVHVLDINVATDSPIGQLLVGIMASVAQWESRRIGERIREAMAAKRAQGRSPNGRPSIGYRVGSDHLLISDDDMRKVVARIVRWRERHRLPYQTIAGLLNTTGSRTVFGRAWSVSTLSHAYRVGRVTTWQDLLDDHDPAPPLCQNRNRDVPLSSRLSWLSTEQRQRAREARLARVISAKADATFFVATVHQKLGSIR